MSRKEQLKEELNILYECSRKAIHIEVIKEYERKINLIEQEIAIILD